MQSDAVRCCQMLSDAVRCCQVLSDAVRCCQMLSDAVRCCQMQSDAVRCSQMLFTQWSGFQKTAGEGVDLGPGGEIRETAKKNVWYIGWYRWPCADHGTVLLTKYFLHYQMKEVDKCIQGFSEKLWEKMDLSDNLHICGMIMLGWMLKK
jgi:hypothetical protein